MATYYYLPNRNIFDVGAVNEIGKFIKTLHVTKPMIVTDKQRTDSRTADMIQSILRAADMESIIFDGVEQNPKDTTIEHGVTFYKTHNCDSLISVGGGSCHDCAKGIGLLVSNGGEISDYEGIDKSENDMIPFMAINLTAGSGSEITRYAFITDTKRKLRMTILDWRIMPKIAINDPLLMTEMPSFITATTGMDALTHAIEAYTSVSATALTDSSAISAIDNIYKYLPKAVANGEYLRAREKMAYAEFMAGIAFNNASLGYVHAMSNQLGGRYDMPHGMWNAIMLPYVMEFNLISNLNRFRDIAAAMGESIDGLCTSEAAGKSIHAVRRLIRQIELPSRLKDVKDAAGNPVVDPKDFDVMAENALKDLCADSNPRKATKGQLVELYMRAYEGKYTY